jgi:hypothetical protein
VEARSFGLEGTGGLHRSELEPLRRNSGNRVLGRNPRDSQAQAKTQQRTSLQQFASHPCFSIRVKRCGLFRAQAASPSADGTTDVRHPGPRLSVTRVEQGHPRPVVSTSCPTGRRRTMDSARRRRNGERTDRVGAVHRRARQGTGIDRHWQHLCRNHEVSVSEQSQAWRVVVAATATSSQKRSRPTHARPIASRGCRQRVSTMKRISKAIEVIQRTIHFGLANPGLALQRTNRPACVELRPGCFRGLPGCACSGRLRPH